MQFDTIWNPNSLWMLTTKDGRPCGFYATGFVDYFILNPASKELAISSYNNYMSRNGLRIYGEADLGKAVESYGDYVFRVDTTIVYGLGDRISTNPDAIDLTLAIEESRHVLGATELAAAQFNQK